MHEKKTVAMGETEAEATVATAMSMVVMAAMVKGLSRPVLG